jgi:hypothetical protein
MARFTGQYEESFVVDAPVGRARAHFSDLETIACNYGNLESCDRDGQTLRVVLEPKKVMKVVYQGRYESHYRFTADNVLEWQSKGDGNAAVSGRAEFIALDDRHTRINYRHTMTCVMDGVGRLVGKAIAPVVAREIRKGVSVYLDRMRGALT